MLVRIECYDKDGKLVKTYGVERTLKDVGHRMYDALDNGLIPVVREAERVAYDPEEIPVGKAAEEKQVEVKEDLQEYKPKFEEAREKLREAIEQMKQGIKNGAVIAEMGQPLLVEWGLPDETHFTAIGGAADVIQVQEEFMDWQDERED